MLNFSKWVKILISLRSDFTVDLTLNSYLKR